MGLSSGRLWKTIVKQRMLILMSFPFLIHLLIFSYVPIWGWLMAFQNFIPGISFFDQQWIGLQHFKILFSDKEFVRVLRNSLAMSVINLVLGFSTAIGLAILLNEVKLIFFKRMVQTISYLPHFVSWVVAATLVLNMLSMEGSINDFLVFMGVIQEPVMWMAKGEYFWSVIGLSNVWKNVGWNAIIYLAAISMINPELYEAAGMDGASRMQKIRHITLPGIQPTIVILLIISIGYLLSSGFEQQFLLRNQLVTDYSDNLEIYVLQKGLAQNQFSFATAAGIFRTLVSFTLLFGANYLAKRLGQERIF